MVGDMMARANTSSTTRPSGEPIVTMLAPYLAAAKVAGEVVLFTFAAPTARRFVRADPSETKIVVPSPRGSGVVDLTATTVCCTSASDTFEP